MKNIISIQDYKVQKEVSLKEKDSMKWQKAFQRIQREQNNVWVKKEI